MLKSKTHEKQSVKVIDLHFDKGKSFHTINSLMQNNLSHNIQHVDQNTYIITHQQEFSDNPTMHPLNQVDELKIIIKQMQEERNHIIESQVLKALKTQEEEFNEFYKENIRKVELHFQTEIIPLRIKAVQSEFYKHQPLSTLTQVTSSSATLIPTETIRMTTDFNEEAYLNQKYEEWKLTYLPVILQLKERQWLQRYESVELQIILKKKFQEWENIRLLSILKQERNKWILQQFFVERAAELTRRYQETLQIKIHQVEQYWEQVLLPQRISSQLTRWNASQQELILVKIRQVQEYWEKVILPQRITQWSIQHASHLSSSEHSINTTTASYTTADLDRILIEEHHKWQLQVQNQIQTRLSAYQRDWEVKMLPQIRQEWQKQYSSTHQLTSSLDTSRIDEIINAKYEEWKHTYLPEYLRLQKIKWFEEYTRNQLQIIIRKKQQEWESLRLLAIIRQPRNYWVIESILKEKQSEQENNILLIQRNKWETTLIERTNEWKLESQRQRQQWELQLERQTNEWKVEMQRQKKEWKVQSQKQRMHWQSTILIEKRSQWQNQYVLLHPQQKQVIMKEVTKQIDIQGQINRHETLWLQRQEEVMRKRVDEVERHWLNIVEQQRLSFQQNLESALQIRTSQIQTYWRQVMIPHIKTEWQSQQLHQLRSVTNFEQDQEKINQRVNERLSIEVQKRIQEWRRAQLPIILQQTRHQWSVNFTQTQQFTTILYNREQELIRQKQAEFEDKLRNVLAQQQLHFESQIKKIQSESIYSLSQLQKTLLHKDQEYRLLQGKLLQVQRTRIQSQPPKQSIDSKEQIQNLKIQNLKYINELKISYQQKLSHINHEKSLLLIQIKQLELTLQNAQKSIRPKQSLNLNAIQSNFDKQILSLEATIKTKQSQNNFLKKSVDTLTFQNQELNSRIIVLNGKLASLQTLVDEARNNSIKLEYEIKYLKQKQSSFNKKIEAKDSQFNQFKSRIEFEKSMLQKKLRQHSSSSQTISSLQLRLNELESQLSLKHSSLKTLENELDRKKRQTEEEKQRSASYLRDFEACKSTIKQHESIIQDLRLQIRKSCDEINRQKLIIEAGEQKERSYMEQVKNIQIKTRDRSQFEDLIRQNERLKLQISRLIEKMVHIESKESMQIYRLKQTIHSLETRLQSVSVNYREGDITEIQILRRIHHEISDLVSNNKQLQMRIIVLENEKELSAFGISIERFFVAFQQQMDNLINYLISSQIWTPDSINSYNKFQQKSRQALTHGYVEDYFRQWQTLMRGLVEQNYEQTFKEFKMMLRSNGNVLKEDEIDEIVEKYDAVLNDVKFTLAEFIKTGDQEYLSLMSKSLGLQIGQSRFQKSNEQASNEGVNEIYQRTIINRK